MGRNPTIDSKRGFQKSEVEEWKGDRQKGKQTEADRRSTQERRMQARTIKGEERGMAKESAYELDLRCHGYEMRCHR